MEEPSILDYLKDKLAFWRKKPATPPNEGMTTQGSAQESISTIEKPVIEPTGVIEKQRRVGFSGVTRKLSTWPWKIILALVLALLAQSRLDTANRDIPTALFLYGFSGLVTILSVVTGEWSILELPKDESEPMSVKIQLVPAVITIPLMLVSFIAFSGNLFTFVNLFLWFWTTFFLILAVWVVKRPRKPFNEWWEDVKQKFNSIHISPWAILIVLAFVLILFFRYYRLSQVPGEMFSDHAEKLLDVGDVLNGKYSIFFTRNTGREFDQFYLSAAIALIFGTGLTFLTLKLGTVFMGVMTLPFVYKLGKEVGNKWVGLFALILAGVAYWPNVISRVALRFTLYPMFTAPTLFFLIRGIRRQNRNDFIWSGIFLGFGLSGYSPMRIVPFIVVFAVLLYLLHTQSKGKRSQTVIALILLAVTSLVIFLPTLRYFTQDPEGFAARALSRVGSSEQPLPGPALQIFTDNFWRAWVMPFYDNGSIWVHSIPGRPALDLVSAAMFFLGLILIVARYIKKHSWVDLFLFCSVPLLMLPSILSLAFPGENPSLNRTAGALVPIFVIAGIGMEGVLSNIKRGFDSRFGTALAVTLGLGLIIWTSANNYDLVFNQYANEFMAGAWNTSDIGQVIGSFADSIGTPDTAYVVPYPYWVDTRLVGINAGYPFKDYALWPQDFASTQEIHSAKLFIVFYQDQTDLDALKAMYPNSTQTMFHSPYEGKDFYILFVPAQ
jgi:Dolichyl-phosphate-mannose-protein mannosyltransferase